MTAHTPFPIDPQMADAVRMEFGALRALLTTRQAATTTGRLGRSGAATTDFDGSFSPAYAADAAAGGEIATNGKGLSPAFLPWRFNLPYAPAR